MLHLAPIPNQFVDSTGVPYSNGKVEVFLTGSTSHAEVYADSAGTRLLENPATLDSHGFWKGFVAADVVMDYLVTDADGNAIFSFDAVCPAGGSGGNSGLQEVSHDSTLSGNGTAADPLGVAEHGISWRHFETQVSDTINSKIDHVEHGSTLKGNGTVNDPLDVSDELVDTINSKLSEVAHDGTLTGKGTQQDPLKVKPFSYIERVDSLNNSVGVISEAGTTPYGTVADLYKKEESGWFRHDEQETFVSGEQLTIDTFSPVYVNRHQFFVSYSENTNRVSLTPGRYYVEFEISIEVPEELVQNRIGTFYGQEIDYTHQNTSIVKYAQIVNVTSRRNLSLSLAASAELVSGTKVSVYRLTVFYLGD